MISLLTGLKIQQQELEQLRGLFIELDIDKNGSLSEFELRSGLQNMQCFELF